LKSPLFFVVLMRDKYLLHIINEIVSVVGLLKDLLYIYKYREIITSYIKDLYNCSTSRIS
jgi:hypothetical protein